MRYCSVACFPKRTPVRNAPLGRSRRVLYARRDRRTQQGAAAPEETLMRAVQLMMMLLLVTWLAVGQAPAPPPAVSGKLGLVRTSDVLAESEEGKAFLAEMDRKFGPRRKQLEEGSAELEELQAEFRQRQTTLSSAQRQQRGLEIQRKQKSMERLGEDLNYDANAAREEGLGRMTRRLRKVVNKYGSERQFMAIFDAAASGVLYPGPGVDITNEILAAYNQRFPVKTETQQ